jgi:hypothetical protein
MKVRKQFKKSQRSNLIEAFPDTDCEHIPFLLHSPGRSGRSSYNKERNR